MFFTYATYRSLRTDRILFHHRQSLFFTPFIRLSVTLLERVCPAVVSLLCVSFDRHATETLDVDLAHTQVNWMDHSMFVPRFSFHKVDCDKSCSMCGVYWSGVLCVLGCKACFRTIFWQWSEINHQVGWIFMHYVVILCFYSKEVG